jgi:rare lipoprotein A
VGGATYAIARRSIIEIRPLMAILLRKKIAFGTKGILGCRPGVPPPASRLPPLLVISVAVALTSACGSAPKREVAAERIDPPRHVATAPQAPAAQAPILTPAPSPAPASPRILRGGGYYLDDGPGDSPPADLDTIPEAVPRWEPLHRGAMRPYVVLGQSFTPMTELAPYKAQGTATWYGRRYHGKPTSTGEPYDMYSMTAAHPTLPLPSYVRVTNVANGKSVVLRVNDRGPFIDNRLIDLSYTAAHRIGLLDGGSALVEVESIIPDGTVVARAAPAGHAPGTLRSTSAVSSSVQLATPRAKSPAAAFDSNAGDDPILAIAAAASETGSTSEYAAPAPDRSAAASSAQGLVARDTRGVYLQLAAFGSRTNAESYLARTKRELDWLAERLHVMGRDGLFRVHAGPYANPAEARRIADRVAMSLGAKPLVVTR